MRKTVLIAIVVAASAAIICSRSDGRSSGLPEPARLYGFELCELNGGGQMLITPFDYLRAVESDDPATGAVERFSFRWKKGKLTVTTNNRGFVFKHYDGLLWQFHWSQESRYVRCYVRWDPLHF